MLELNQLRCFVAVAEELHFRRAAQRLHMTQPPLSRQIQLLEHQLGTRLLLRSNRSVRLTAAGQELLRQAYGLLGMAESLGWQVRRVGLGEAGRIVIGFTAAASYGYLPLALARWSEALPGVDLQLREMVSAVQWEGLAAGRVDIGLLRPLRHREGYRSRVVIREPLVAALPKDHPLADQGSLSLSDFHRRPFIMYSPDEARYFHELIVRLFHSRGIEPNYSQYIAQIHSMLALVRGGLGLALVPQSATGIGFEGLLYREVEELRADSPVELHMLWKQGNGNPALQRLLDIDAGQSGDSAAAGPSAWAE